MNTAIGHVRLMGMPHVRIGARTWAFCDDKRYQLLAYLAFTGDWVRRETLAYMFWPETDTGTARKDLRHLLGRVRGLGWLDNHLEAEGERLRWSVPTDVQAFLKAIQESYWERALELYGGTLLEGFWGDGSAEFSAWLETEREHLSGCWRSAVLKRAETLRKAGNPQEASQLLAKLLEHDELDEEALEAYLWTTVEAGRRGQALKAYGKFCERLSQELDLRPTVALEQLAHAIRQEDPRLLAVAPAPQHEAPIARNRSLPIPATPFVGRNALLAEIAQLLHRGEYRLLTLIGPGGVGKTRLALQTAYQQRERFAGGVYFASLVALSSPNSLAAALAEALGFGFQGSQPPLEQLARHIAEGEVLLVLDNFEHLLEAAPQVAELLAQCPGLRVLVTSRERLGLEAEQILPIAGFPLPADPAQAVHSDAVQLFSLRVQRLRPRFRLEEGNVSSILEICRLVEGSPLGIELAAAWARVLPLGAISVEIRRDTDFLAAQSPDLARRHQSIRQVFEHSWRLLTSDEQQALNRLSVFKGGFSREAAKLAARVPLPVLASLTDKSLLYTDAEGRFFRHALLFQYMGEKLAEDPLLEQEARSEHAGYYLRVLQRCLEEIRGANPKATFALMEAELENLRSAWRWAIGESKAHLIKAGTEALMRFFDARKRYQEGIEVFAEAIAGLSPDQPEHRAALGTLLVHQAKMFLRQGHYDTAEALTLQALALLRPLEEFEPVIWGLGTLGETAAFGGNHPRALAHKEEALSLAQSIGSERLTAVCWGWLAITEDNLGHYERSKAHYRQAIRLFRKLGNRIGALYNLNNLSALSLDQGHPEESRTLALEALEQARLTGTRSLEGEILMRLGSACQQLGRYSEAARYSLSALELAKDELDLPLEIEIHLSLSTIAAAQQQPLQSKEYLRQALEGAWSIQHLPLVMKTLVGWADYFLAQAQPSPALQLLWLTSRHPATLSSDKDRAQHILRGYEANLAPPALPPLEEVVEPLLYG